MVTTILLLIILIISLILITFRVYSISILLGAITIFILGSIILFQHNHILIGSIFLVVYSGAILVFICISLLISPAIRPQNIQENKNEKTIQNLRIFFFLFCFTFFTLFFSFYLTNYITEPKIAIEYKDLILNNSSISVSSDIQNFEFKIFSHSLKSNINGSEYLNFLLSEKDINFTVSNLLPQITQNTFDISSFNFSNIISINYKDDFFIIIMIGIYLFITLLCCLVLFSINHQKRVIKRQDGVDQILKRWL